MTGEPKRRDVWREALRAIVCFATALWLVELVASLIRRRGLDRLELQGALGGWFLAMLAALVLGAPLALVWAASIGRRSSADAIREAARGARRWAFEDDPVAHARRLSTVGAVSIVLLVVAFLSLSFGQQIVVRIAQPKNVALAELLLHLGLLVVALALFPFARVLASLPLRLAARVPGIRWLVQKSGRFLLVALAVGLVLTTLWAVLWREFIARFLPWQETLIVALAALLTLPLLLLVTRLVRARRALRWSFFGLWLFAVVVTGVVGARLPLAASRARTVMVDLSLAGRTGFAVLSLLTDVDRDGAVPGFTGGDCAPFRSRIHPSAVDVPSNGIDENCDGDDLVLASLTELSGRSDYPVPNAWPRRPPILLITIDALAARHLKFFGGERVTAPTIDRLAREGVAFRSCFAQGPSTRLSFPSIFTSRYDSEIHRTTTGRYPFPILPENVMLAEQLAQAGYRTAAVVSNDYFQPTRWKGLTQGFETVDSEPARYWRTGLNADHVTDGALRVLQKPDERPLFLWVHYYDPHDPHVQPPGMPVFGKERSDRYDAKISWVDHHVSRLLDEARRVLGKDLLVVLSADHGYAFDSQHTKAGYGYDLSTTVMHVPLIFHARYFKPSVDELLVSTLDITPTITNILRLGSGVGTRGFSLVPALSGGSERRPQLVFHQAFLTEAIQSGREPLWLAGVRTPRYTMTLDRMTGRVSAYEWTTDYDEQNDLWQTQAGSADLRALKDTLDAFVFASQSNLVR